MWVSFPKYCIGSDSGVYVFVGSFGLPDSAGVDLVEGYLLGQGDPPGLPVPAPVSDRAKEVKLHRFLI